MVCWGQGDRRGESSREKIVAHMGWVSRHKKREIEGKFLACKKYEYRQ